MNASGPHTPSVFTQAANSGSRGDFAAEGQQRQQPRQPTIHFRMRTTSLSRDAMARGARSSLAREFRLDGVDLREAAQMALFGAEGRGEERLDERAGERRADDARRPGTAR